MVQIVYEKSYTIKTVVHLNKKLPDFSCLFYDYFLNFTIVDLYLENY